MPVQLRHFLSTGLMRVSRVLRGRIRAAACLPGLLVGLLSIAVLWAGVLHGLAAQRRAAIEGALGDTAKFASTFEEQVLGIIRTVDQTLHYVRQSYQRDRGHFDIDLWSGNGRFVADPSLHVSIIDRNGHLVASSLGPIAHPLDLSDRDAYRTLSGDKRDSLFIGPPAIDRMSGRLSVQFARPIIASDGSFDGVVAVSLDPLRLSRFYESVKLGSDGAVALVGTDGIIRARAPNPQVTIGQSLDGTSLMQAVARNPIGSLTAPGRVDGIARFYSYRTVADYPLLVVVGVSEPEVLAQYDQGRCTYLGVAGLVSALVLVVIALIVRHQRRLARAHVALQASELRYAEKSQMLELTLDNMTHGIMLIGADETLEVVNRRAATLLELPKSLLGTRSSMRDVLRVAWRRGEFGPCHGEFEAWYDGFLKEQPLYIREHHLANGTIVEIRNNQLPDGRVVRTFTDITERKRAEDALRAARDEANRSAQVKSEFLAMMSHEIRTPMSGLLGIIELLRDTRLDAEQGHMVELVHGSASSLLRILNDVLNLAKIDAGAVELAPEAVDLRALVVDLLGAMTPAADGKALSLTGAVADDVPGWVSTDPMRLRQILTNLLSNAIKFTACGAATLHVACAASPDGAPELEFTVRDTGIGIAPEVIGRLFEPFSQADGSTTKLFGGTGLGLTISRRLGRLLGGDVTVTSEQGTGSVFTLILPLVAAAGPVIAAAAEACASRGTLDRIRILVAEDQVTNRWLIQRQLDRLGCAVTAVEDGRAALAAVDAGEYELIITDCHMPGIDGIELTRLIRGREVAHGRRHPPILGLTADVTGTMRERCLAVGMNDVATKPINLRHLHATILRLTEMRCAERPEPELRTEAAVFDASTYLELFADDVDAGREWLQAYLASADELVCCIGRAVAAGNSDEIGAVAHRLAGIALSAGATRLGGLARALEADARSASRYALDDQVHAIVRAHDGTCAAIMGFIAEPAAVP